MVIDQKSNPTFGLNVININDEMPQGIAYLILYQIYLFLLIWFLNMVSMKLVPLNIINNIDKMVRLQLVL